MGMGMGFGVGPLMSGLLTGGMGYLLGQNSANRANQQMQAQQQVPPYYYQPPAMSSSSSNTGDDVLKQLQLLGELHERGVLTDQEFESEKRRLLNR
jgi:hypothetical protein